MKRLCDYKAALSNIDLSSLLGISQLEYEHLIHSPLYHYKNEDGAVTEFFMYISPLNCDNLLHKIRKNNCNIAVFKPSDIFKLNRQQFSLSDKEAEQSIGAMCSAGFLQK
jgi:hypothetical protein